MFHCHWFVVFKEVCGIHKVKLRWTPLAYDIILNRSLWKRPILSLNDKRLDLEALVSHLRIPSRASAKKLRLCRSSGCAPSREDAERCLKGRDHATCKSSGGQLNAKVGPAFSSFHPSICSASRDELVPLPKEPLMASHCQLDWILNHLRDITLGPIFEENEKFNWGVKTPSHSGTDYSIPYSWAPDWIKRRKSPVRVCIPLPPPPISDSWPRPLREFLQPRPTPGWIPCSFRPRGSITV